jgi:diketogulonate reductase-like aldo/keto reductase
MLPAYTSSGLSPWAATELRGTPHVTDDERMTARFHSLARLTTLTWVIYHPCEWGFNCRISGMALRRTTRCALRRKGRYRRVQARTRLDVLQGLGVLLIPGTSSRGHLAENLAAGSLALSADEVAALSAAFDEG